MTRKISRIEKNKKKTSYKIKKILTNIVLFIVANVIIVGAFSIPVIYYGPLKNTKEFLVTTAMTTLRHQYIATWFLSSEEIEGILNKNKIVNDQNSDIDKIAVSAVPILNEVETVKDPYDGVKITNISNDNYKGYILTIDNPKRISVASSNKLGKTGMQLEEIVKVENAIAAINAGGFQDEDGRGSGGTPLGVVIHNGQVIYGKEGMKYSVIGFNNKGILVLGNYNLEEIKEKNIMEAVSFSPFLIVDGKPEIKNGNGGWGIAPRTVIGQRKDGSVLLLVIDGRQVGSLGATLREVQDLLLQYEVYNAANLDGGASTIMYYKDKIVNKPSSSSGPRPLPTAFIVK